jgi:nucleotide-binding universal stress UspA family protein
MILSFLCNFQKQEASLEYIDYALYFTHHSDQHLKDILWFITELFMCLSNNYISRLTFYSIAIYITVLLSHYTPFNLTNRKISNILVAIDGSEYSFKAAEYALDLAKLLGAQLFAITVTYIPQSDHLSQKDVLSKSLIEDKIDNKSTKDAENWFENFILHAKENSIQLKTELINSARPVDYMIIEYAEEQKIDLIVVGTRGRTGFKKLFLGSVASSIVTYAHCPVMVIK